MRVARRRRARACAAPPARLTASRWGGAGAGVHVRWTGAPPGRAPDPRRAAGARRRARHRTRRRGPGDGDGAGAGRAAPTARRRPRRRHGLHVPRPRAGDRPRPGGARRRRRCSSAPGPTSPTPSHRGRRDRGPGRPLRLGRPLRAAARRVAGGRPAHPGRGWNAPSPTPTTTPSSTARSPTGPGSAGSARTPTCSLPGAGSWFVLGCVVTTAPLPSRGGPGRRRLRGPAAAASTPARPRRSSSRAWSTPAAAWPGCCQKPGVHRAGPAASPSATASTGATTARRSARRRCTSARRHRRRRADRAAA